MTGRTPGVVFSENVMTHKCKLFLGKINHGAYHVFTVKNITLPFVTTVRCKNTGRK